ncbi:GNS1/SUR4 family-domain-containing protein [Xylariaceae sp. FL0255]|nr:GNS1/SUR4 family-domain-containing protein [Xylariaceae sp. FL0255]
MATPILFASPPAATLFKLPPHTDPRPIPLPHFDYPFTIPDNWYTAALEPSIPITIALVYAVTAKALNAYNKSTGKKPWAISKTRAFHVFVILHNVFLAVYSAWTWLGMLRAFRNSVVNPNGPDGWAGTVDSVCKLHGSPGMANSQTYNPQRGAWESLAGSFEGAPSRVERGRLWNEGLAFYGWIFYISKFYEVLDTLIILAKGKFSSTLQTYHHAGAMMAMWAGMRYMASPVWIFVLFNSGIHALMYTYYTLTAFNIRVPSFIKRTLTSMQISQFVIGAAVAIVHSFVSYIVPVTKQVAVAETVSVVDATAPAAGLVGSIKSALINAAEATGARAIVSDSAAQEAAKFITVFEKADCIYTAGQTFAIWLNVLYLAPLTYLFVSFFIASYLRRSKAETFRGKTAEDRRRSNVVLAEKASWDAARGLEREMYGESKEGVIVEDSDESSGSQQSRQRVTRSGSAKTSGH